MHMYVSGQPASQQSLLQDSSVHEPSCESSAAVEPDSSGQHDLQAG